MSERFIQKNETAFVGIKSNLRDALEAVERLEDFAQRTPLLKSRNRAQHSYRTARDTFPGADSILFRRRVDNPTLIEKNPHAPQTLLRALGLMR